MSTERGQNTHYPDPIVPMSPVLSTGTYSGHHKQLSSIPSILACAHTKEVTSGRAAIALALEHCHTGPGDEVLIPAFHCESMISPATWREATPVFFRVDAQGYIELEDIEHKITPRTKAIIVTHYFGFLQDLSALRTLCDTHQIVIIEDCAHAFFGTHNGVSVGTVGDYATASSMKFFPCYDGGVLASNVHALDALQLHACPRLFDLKSLFNTVERAISFKRLGWFGKVLKGLLSCKQLLWNCMKKTRASHVVQGPSSSDGGFGFESAWVHSSASKTAQWIVNHADKKRIIDSRRHNYLRYQAALCNLQDAYPLFEQLPEGCVPLVFPLYVKNPAQPFTTLKHKAVPIWRFGEYLDPAINETVCPSSMDLSAHVFQFPCHQELRDEEITWIIEQITATLN